MENLIDVIDYKKVLKLKYRKMSKDFYVAKTRSHFIIIACLYLASPVDITKFMLKIFSHLMTH